jgi:dTDP-glucose 4,6-dehydratase
MYTYLVTGAAGFIGTNFLHYMLTAHPHDRFIALDALTYAGHLASIQHLIDDRRCIFIHGNIADAALVHSLFERFHIHYVVNFAAESHVDRSIDDPQIFLTTNILGTQTLLHAALTASRHQPLIRFHQVSTDEVYGALGPHGFFTETTPLNPHSPYSASKAAADFFVNAYRDTYGLPTSISRCSNNYGPFHFPEKLIPLTITNILAGKPLPVYGDGSNIRDWLFVDDHCRAIDLILHRAPDGACYNVGGHNERSNIDIVRGAIDLTRELLTEFPAYRRTLARQDLGSDGAISIDWINHDLITFVADRPGHDFRYAIDPSKIAHELGWRPSTSFDEGLRLTIRWFLDNQPWLASLH